MYKSPVELFMRDIELQVNEKLEEACYTAVMEYFPNVNREELLRALKYDRDQYDRGYEDGKRDAVVHARWVDIYGGKYANQVYKCSACRKDAPIDEHYPIVGRSYTDWSLTDYCPHCGARMDAEVAE